MSLLAISSPEPNEYASYYGKYVSLVEGNDILPVLELQARDTNAFLSARDEKDGDLRYAPDKWSVNQLLGHLCDSERIFAYRALCIARADQTPLPGFEQDDYVRNGPFADCRLKDLLEEFASVRQATLSLFRNLRPNEWMRRGMANQNEVSVRALAYVIAGHELHHRRVLQEKYFA